MRMVLTGRKQVAAAGTAEQLADPLPCTQVDIFAERTNTDIVAIGMSKDLIPPGWSKRTSGVVATAAAEEGAPLGKGERYTAWVNDISEIWIDAAVATEGVTFVAYA